MGSGQYYDIITVPFQGIGNCGSPFWKIILIDMWVPDFNTGSGIRKILAHFKNRGISYISSFGFVRITENKYFLSILFGFFRKIEYLLAEIIGIDSLISLAAVLICDLVPIFSDKSM